MTDEILKEIKEALEFTIEDLPHGEYGKKTKLKKALASLNAYIEARESEEMVEKVAKAFIDQLKTQDDCGGVHHSDDIANIGIDGYFDFEEATKAAIKAMEGKDND